MNDTKSESKVETFALSLGMVDYSGRGRNLNRVAVTVELRHKVNTVAPYLDVDLNPCREYVELSMTGEIWNAAGTDCASCGQNLEEIGKLFPDKRAVQRLVEIWGRWHLNGMKAGTRLQEAYLRDNPVTDRLDHYTKACAALEKANLLHVTGPDGRNYKYGAAWLVERLPDEIAAEVRALCGELSTPEAKAHLKAARDFSTRHGITLTAEQTDSNPNMERQDADHWRVTLRRGRKSMTLVYSKGLGHNGEVPTAIEVLGCLASDARGADASFEEWARDLGMETDSRQAERTYKAVRRQTAKLKAFLGADLMAELIDENDG